MFVLEAIVSAAQFAALALLIGALVTAGFLLPGGEPAEIRRTLLSFSRPLLAAFLTAALCFLIIQGAKLAGGALLSVDILSRYLLRTWSGKIWLAREAYAAILLAVTLWTLRHEGSVKQCRRLFLLSLPLVAGRSLTSHSIAAKDNLSLLVSADSVHLVATALWAGGLPILTIALYQGLRRHRLPLSWAGEMAGGFSRLAVISVAAIVLTGSYQTWTHVQKLSLLWNSPYGRILLLKLALFLGMVAFGAVNFFSTRRSLSQAGAPEDSRRLEKRALFRIGSESAMGLVVLGITGFLTILPPGIHSLHSTVQQGGEAAPLRPAPKRSFLEQLARFVVPSMAMLAPPEGASVTLLSPQEGDIFEKDEIPIRYEFVKGKRGNHLHAYVDEQLMGMFSGPESGTLTGISPGRHTLVVRVVADDHVTELDATDRVDFVVK